MIEIEMTFPVNELGPESEGKGKNPGESLEEKQTQVPIWLCNSGGVINILCNSISFL